MNGIISRLADGKSLEFPYAFDVVFRFDTTFISKMPDDHIALLKKLGWNCQNVNFIELPFWVSWVEPLTPAVAGVNIVSDLDRSVYYRVLHMTKDWIDRAPEQELTDDILHEQYELRVLEQRCTSGDLTIFRESSAAYLRNEERLQLETRKSLRLDTKEKIEVTRKTLQVLEQIQKSRPCIPGNFLQIWLMKYFANQDLSLANRMPDPMKSPEMKEGIERAIDRVLYQYASRFGIIAF